MEFAKHIAVAPKNGDLIVLEDNCSWELGRWSPEANGWVQFDGTPVRISPTHWTPLSDDVDDATDREGLLFPDPPLPDDEAEQTRKRPLTRLIPAFVTAIFCVGGLVVWIGSEQSSSDRSAAHLEREFSQERDRAYAAIGGLAAARQRENVALTEALESKRVSEKELLQALAESEKRAFALERELNSARKTSARKTIASAEKPSNAEVTAQDAASPTGPLNRPIETMNAASATPGSMTIPQGGGNVTAGVQVSSDTMPADATATAGASGRLTRSNRSQPSRPQPDGHVEPNALVQANAQAQRGERPNGIARVTPQAAQQGRFAARFAARAQGANFRAGTAALAPRRAWSLGLPAAFVPWHGPVFWPYAYSDVFDYAFWPSGYDDGYFAYAYDDFFDGVFWGQAGPPPEYSYAYAPPNARLARSTSSTAEELCTRPGTGITAWPFAEIKSKVGVNTEQKELLEQVRSAGHRAASVFKASCPAKHAFAMTPPGRLHAMTLRLTATLEAVQTVRPAMEKFYNGLSDEQKERLSEIGPKQPENNAEGNQTSARDAKSCGEPKAGLANLPIERIEDTVKPTNAQEDGLKHLEKVTAKAVSILQAACPEDTPITPPGRLEVMEKRLQAMIDAADTVKPALNEFYGSLSSEQKARFNIIGGAQSGNYVALSR